MVSDEAYAYLNEYLTKIIYILTYNFNIIIEKIIIKNIIHTQIYVC